MAISADILEQVVRSSAEPLVIVRVDHTNWPVVLSNPAFDAIGGDDTVDKPFADVDRLVDIELLYRLGQFAEIKRTNRSREQASRLSGGKDKTAYHGCPPGTLTVRAASPPTPANCSASALEVE